ncbi:hypothetical protein WDU94_010739 [Cyamophila willieti]
MSTTPPLEPPAGAEVLPQDSSSIHTGQQEFHDAYTQQLQSFQKERAATPFGVPSTKGGLTSKPGGSKRLRMVSPILNDIPGQTEVAKKEKDMMVAFGKVEKLILTEKELKQEETFMIINQFTKIKDNIGQIVAAYRILYDRTNENYNKKDENGDFLAKVRETIRDAVGKETNGDNKDMDNMKTMIEQLSTEVRGIKNQLNGESNKRKDQISYANAVRVPGINKPVIPRNKPQLLIYPDEGRKEELGSSQATKDVVTRTFKPSTIGVRVEKIREIRDAGISIELTTEEDANLLKEQDFWTQIGDSLRQLEAEINELYTKQRRERGFDIPEDKSHEQIALGESQDATSVSGSAAEAVITTTITVFTTTTTTVSSGPNVQSPASAPQDSGRLDRLGASESLVTITPLLPTFTSSITGGISSSRQVAHPALVQGTEGIISEYQSLAQNVTGISSIHTQMAFPGNLRFPTPYMSSMGSYSSAGGPMSTTLLSGSYVPAQTTVPIYRDLPTVASGSHQNPGSTLLGYQGNTYEVKARPPRVDPPCFDGKEDVEEFLKGYNLAASVNNWDDALKCKYLPIFVRGPAKTLFENKIENRAVPWCQIEDILRSYFTPVGNEDLVEYKMRSRVQGPVESAEPYMQEKLGLINKFDRQMTEVNKAKLIMYGLLFPTVPPPEWAQTEIDPDTIPIFTMDELVEEAINMKNKTAPGPDGVVPEIVKHFVLACPDYVLEVFNNILKQGIFPSMWKRARVVLLPKPGKPPLHPSSYRPLCLLDTFSKLLEKLLVRRMNEELGNQGLSNEQYGFRAGKSTVDAIQRVFNIANDERAKSRRRRGLCLMVTLDVRNVFNSAPWDKIVESLEAKNISPYILRLFKSYFNDRYIITSNGTTIRTTVGAPPLSYGIRCTTVY